MGVRATLPIAPKPGRGTAGSRLDRLRKQAAACRRCPLWRRGTQTVFGEGASRAPIMLVGEQPGDVEDRRGHPFVGPAGTLLRELLEEADIAADDVYLTNAVKHFKWRAQGKRRIHERPNREEILACRMWLDEEIAAVQPRTLIALGATAASVIFGNRVRVMRDRGKRVPSDLAKVAAVTVHPSSILRAPGATARRLARQAFVKDLKRIVADR